MGYYLPVLLVAGVLTGLGIGVVSQEVLKRIRNICFEKREKEFYLYDFLYN